MEHIASEENLMFLTFITDTNCTNSPRTQAQKLNFGVNFIRLQNASGWGGRGSTQPADPYQREGGFHRISHRIPDSLGQEGASGVHLVTAVCAFQGVLLVSYAHNPFVSQRVNTYFTIQIIGDMPFRGWRTQMSSGDHPNSLCTPTWGSILTIGLFVNCKSDICLRAYSKLTKAGSTHRLRESMSFYFFSRLDGL